MGRRSKVILVAVLLGLVLSVPAGADLAERIDKVISTQKGTTFSIQVVDADSGKTVYAHDAHGPLIPASNMKLVTTAVALKRLGGDFVYTTRIAMCGEALVVVGSGDPLLGYKEADKAAGREAHWILADIADKLKQAGVETVQDIVVDTTVFDDQRVHPSWPRKELNRQYACEVCGLNYDGNCVELTVEKGDAGVAVTVEPETAYVRIVHSVKPAENGATKIGAYRNRTANKITVRGTCKSRFGPFDVAIEKPAAFFGFLIAESVAKEGIVADGQLIEGPLGDDCELDDIAVYETPLTVCLAETNKESFGLAAEALFKTVAAHSTGAKTNGSWKKGAEIVTRYLLDLGVPRQEFEIDDGSGLSRENRLSAFAVMQVLLDMYECDDWEIYRDSLAVGGVDGTAGDYFQEARYKERIRGKTGYLTGVKAFSGICATDKGEYFFAILANNRRGVLTRKAINDIAKAIIDEYSQ